MVEISLNTSGEGVYQKQIAENQDISVKYLDHIIYALKAAGLITNLKGKKSGYSLTRSPSEITLYDIHNAFEPGIYVIDCLSPNITCDREGRCAAKGFWNKLNNQVIDYFKSMTLDDLVKEQIKLNNQIKD